MEKDQKSPRVFGRITGYFSPGASRPTSPPPPLPGQVALFQNGCTRSEEKESEQKTKTATGAATDDTTRETGPVGAGTVLQSEERARRSSPTYSTPKENESPSPCIPTGPSSLPSTGSSESGPVLKILKRVMDRLNNSTCGPKWSIKKTNDRVHDKDRTELALRLGDDHRYVVTRTARRWVVTG